MRQLPEVEGDHKLAQGPLPDHTHVVLLGVPDEASLMRVADRLTRRGLVFKLIREPDSPWNNAATAIGIAPTYARRAVRRELGGLKGLD